MREEIQRIINEQSQRIYDALLTDSGFMQYVRPENNIEDIRRMFDERIDALILDKLIPEHMESDAEMYTYNIMCDDEAKRQMWTDRIFNDLISRFRVLDVSSEDVSERS